MTSAGIARFTPCDDRTAVGLIGLGLVGTALAGRLLDRGFAIIGYDIDPARIEALVAIGGHPASGPADVARYCSRIFLALMNTSIVQQVIEGPGGMMEATPLPSHILDVSTGNPEETRALAERLRRQGIAFLDCPVSGSSRLIRSGHGVFLVGGRAEDFEFCRDLFEALSARAVHLGPSGSGSKAKLASNLILGLNRAALAEGLVLAEKLGLDLPQFLELLRISPAYSRAVDDKGAKMIQGDFRAEARLSQHHKDLSIILETAESLGLELPLARVHSRVLQEGIESGEGDLDNSAVIRAIRRRTKTSP